MHTTKNILDALAARAGSDRKAAAMIGVTQPTFSEWRTGKTFPSDERAVQFATLLGFPPEYFIAIIQHDRAKSADVRAAWSRIAEAFAKAAAIAAVTIGAGVGTPPPANAAPAAESVCVMSTRRRRRAAWFGALETAAELVRKITSTAQPPLQLA